MKNGDFGEYLDSAKFQMMLAARSIHDLRLMRSYYMRTGNSYDISRLYDLHLYFGNDSIYGVESFTDKIVEVWEWIKAKVISVINSILTFFGGKPIGQPEKDKDPSMLITETPMSFSELTNRVNRSTTYASDMSEDLHIGDYLSLKSTLEQVRQYLDTEIKADGYSATFAEYRKSTKANRTVGSASEYKTLYRNVRDIYKGYTGQLPSYVTFTGKVLPNRFDETVNIINIVSDVVGIMSEQHNVVIQKSDLLKKLIQVQPSEDKMMAVQQEINTHIKAIGDIMPLFTYINGCKLSKFLQNFADESVLFIAAYQSMQSTP